MIEKYLKPESITHAMTLKTQYGAQAVYFGGGSKLNATPTKTDKTVAIALSEIGKKDIIRDGKEVRIGAMMKLQSLLESADIPPVLQQAIGFIYSRNIRNQATLGGEIAALQEESALLPALLVLQAKLLLGDGNVISLEDYLDTDHSVLIDMVIIPDISLMCATHRVCRSAAGLAVLTAAVSIDSAGKKLIALDGVLPKPARLSEIENLAAECETLEKAVAAAVKPKADIRGSVEYKRYISGVVVADLLTACEQGGK